MPYLRIQTNLQIDQTRIGATLSRASALVAKELNKPETYVMVTFAPTQPMVFAGDDQPCAYLELKSIGLPESKTKNLSASLCHLMQTELGVSVDRVYIEFSDAPRAMWGWNNDTF